jgi:hypothetical protein
MVFSVFPIGRAAAHHIRMLRGWTRRARILLLAILPACAGLADYAHDRGADAVDILRGHVMIGVGFDGMLQFTRGLRLGAGFYDAACAGLANRELAAWREKVQEGGVAFFHGRFEETHGVARITGSYGTVAPWPEPRLLQADESWLDLLDIRATALFGIGVDIEFRLGQLFDFVGGIFLWDPAGDDDAAD